MKRFFPSPLGMDFETWAALMAEQLADLGVSAPKTDENWVSWGQGLLNFPELVTFPDPYGFSKWDDWAVRVVEMNVN